MATITQGSLSSQAASTGVWVPAGYFSASITGTFTATVALERASDNSSTANYAAVARDSAGTAASYTAATGGLACFEPEGAFYRFNCTSYTSGTINYRLGQRVPG